MSIACMNWAMGQATGSPSAQCVLYVIADVASEKGVAWPSVGYMAKRSQQSADTVRRRLRELEKLGLLVRLQRYDKSGRRTSDEIRLKLDVTVAAASASGEDDEEESGHSDGVIPAQAGIQADSDLDPGFRRGDAEQEARRPSCGTHASGMTADREDREGDPGNLRGSPLADCEGPLAPVQGSPSHCCEGHNEPSKEPSYPKTPSCQEARSAERDREAERAEPPQGSAGEGPSQDADAEPDKDGQQEARSGAQPHDREDQQHSTLEAFKAAYPIPSTKPQDVDALWAALAPPERAQATKGAAGYAVFVDKRQRKPMDPVRFLRDPALWAEFAPHAPPPPPPPPVFVAAGPPKARLEAWRAWCVWRAMAGDPAPKARMIPEAGREGAYFSQGLPPCGLALAGHARGDGGVDTGQWPIVEFGTREWWAWNDRWQIWTGKPLEADVIATGETYAMALFGEEREMPHKVKGRRLPTPWPPSRRPTSGTEGAEQDEGEESESDTRTATTEAA